MEALLEKEGDVESWNDERLDELSRRVDAGFEKAATKVELTAVKDEMNLRFGEVDRRLSEMGQQMNQGFAEVNTQLGRLNDRLDRFVSTFVIVSATVAAAVIGNAVFG
jgi:hypothetical protein